MTTIRAALEQFIAQTDEVNSSSTSPPFMIIDLFAKCLDEYGPEDLNKFVQVRFNKEWSEDHRFCDMFGPDHIQPFHINFFLSTYVIRNDLGSKASLKACGPVMEKLAAWLRERGHWDEAAMRAYRELVGDNPGQDLVACDAFGDALHGYVASHPADDAGTQPYDDYFDGQFTIKKVEADRMILEGPLDDGDDIRISLPRSVTAKARPGWSVTMELARIKGKWRILGVGNVYP